MLPVVKQTLTSVQDILWQQRYTKYDHWRLPKQILTKGKNLGDHIRLMQRKSMAGSQRKEERVVLAHPPSLLMQTSCWSGLSNSWFHLLLVGSPRGGSISLEAACLVVVGQEKSFQATWNWCLFGSLAFSSCLSISFLSQYNNNNSHHQSSSHSHGSHYVPGT